MLMNDIYLIAGLGNPGRRYEKTRHNTGFYVVDLISEKYGIKLSRLKHRAYTGEGNIEGSRVLLVKPVTYMNLIGECIKSIVDWYGIEVNKENNGFDHLIVIYDDIDLSRGQIRIRRRGSAGTHNGMKSVIYQLETDEFPRIRVGIGRPPEGWELKNYVLGRFEKEEYQSVIPGIQMAAESVSKIIKDGIEKAMNEYN
jgi:peptidyl-tRNA hydrolase, PTH1 family